MLSLGPLRANQCMPLIDRIYISECRKLPDAHAHAHYMHTCTCIHGQDNSRATTGRCCQELEKCECMFNHDSPLGTLARHILARFSLDLLDGLFVTMVLFELQESLEKELHVLGRHFQRDAALEQASVHACSTDTGRDGKIRRQSILSKPPLPVPAQAAREVLEHSIASDSTSN